ncbi:MAG: PadR family transcriptional regulator [Actinomycetota bacterium]|nr:PadR family transcriptional regulator [Actinomycetota bacterium]
MLELAILGLLKEQELHGYELKKRLVEALGQFSRVSFGSLYPALRRLQAAGALQTAETRPRDEPPAPAIPMTGSIAGEAAAFRLGRSGGRRTESRSSRVRKVYRITPRGEELFAELLAADSWSADDDRAFNLKLAFCRYLPPEARLGLLERRRAQLVERLATVRTTMRTRRERMDRYLRSLIDHDAEATERDISWLDALIASEKQGLRTADPAPSDPRRPPQLSGGAGIPADGPDRAQPPAQALTPPGRRPSS